MIPCQTYLLSIMEVTQEQDLSSQQVVVFQIGSEFYAIDIFAVHEIIRMREITPIPSAPKHVQGLINLRGKTIPVVDFAAILGLARPDLEDSARIIVVESEGGNVGIIVNAVKEVITFDTEDIEDAPKVSSEHDDTSVEGVAKHQGKLVTLINLDKALAA